VSWLLGAFAGAVLRKAGFWMLYGGG
jgi:hypothetical protein